MIIYLDILFMNFQKRFCVELDRPVWAPVGKDPLCPVDRDNMGQDA